MTLRRVLYDDELDEFYETGDEERGYWDRLFGGDVERFEIEDELQEALGFYDAVRGEPGKEEYRFQHANPWGEESARWDTEEEVLAGKRFKPEFYGVMDWPKDVDFKSQIIHMMEAGSIPDPEGKDETKTVEWLAPEKILEHKDRMKDLGVQERQALVDQGRFQLDVARFGLQQKAQTAQEEHRERQLGVQALPSTFDEALLREFEKDTLDINKIESLIDLRERPTSLQRFQEAVKYATSPSDYFTLMALTRGTKGSMVPQGQMGRVAPRAEWLEKAATDFFEPRSLFERLAKAGPGGGAGSAFLQQRAAAEPQYWTASQREMPGLGAPGVPPEVPPEVRAEVQAMQPVTPTTPPTPQQEALLDALGDVEAMGEVLPVPPTPSDIYRPGGGVGLAEQILASTDDEERRRHRTMRQFLPDAPQTYYGAGAPYKGIAPGGPALGELLSGFGPFMEKAFPHYEPPEPAASPSLLHGPLPPGEMANQLAERMVNSQSLAEIKELQTQLRSLVSDDVANAALQRAMGLPPEQGRATRLPPTHPGQVMPPSTRWQDVPPSSTWGGYVTTPTGPETESRLRRLLQEQYFTPPETLRGSIGAHQSPDRYVQRHTRGLPPRDTFTQNARMFYGI